MLCFDRRKNERIAIETPAGLVTVQVCRMGTEKVSIGITAGEGVSITRPDMAKQFDPESRVKP